MDHDQTCVVCARLARPRGDDGIFVVELSESIAILADELDRTLALTGCPSIGALTADLIAAGGR